MSFPSEPKASQGQGSKTIFHGPALYCMIWLLGIGPAAGQMSSSVTLAWDPSVDPSPAGYRVYEGVASHSYTNMTQFGNVPQATLYGLTPGVTYFLAVTVLDSDGLESTFSNEITYTAPIHSNLVEYAVGSDLSNSVGANTGIIVRINQDTGNRYLTMQFKRRTDAASLQLQYVPEVSSDKQTWDSDNANVSEISVTPLDSEFDSVTVQDMTPITPEAARFIHLRVVSGNTASASPAWIGAATTLQGNGGAGSKFTTFSQRMVAPLLYAGTVSTLESTTLTDTNAAWSDGEFGGVANPAYVEFDNGYMVDIADTSATTKTLSLAGNMSGLVSPGDAYRVRQHLTIASLFGTNNETGLVAGPNLIQADTILLQIPQTHQTVTIFYFSNAVAQGWLDGNFSPAANQVIYPNQGVLVRRITPGAVNLYECGPIKTGVSVATIEPGPNLVGTLKSLSSPTLDSLNLYTGDPATGVASGLTTTLSDSVLVMNPDGSTAMYFYFKNPSGYEGWLDARFNPAGNATIQAGSALLIQRRAANGPFDWTIPAD